jgi:hypothetical protein
MMNLETYFTYTCVCVCVCARARARLCSICYFLQRLMKNLESAASGALILRATLNMKIKNEDGLLAYLSTKIIESTDSVADAQSSNKKVVWTEDDREKWLGAVPKVELVYDDRYLFVLNVTLTVDTKASNATEDDLLNILLQVCVANVLLMCC